MLSEVYLLKGTHLTSHLIIVSARDHQFPVICFDRGNMTSSIATKQIAIQYHGTDTRFKTPFFRMDLIDDEL
jgi:hypothetical protein